MDKFRLTECQTLDIPAGNDVPLLVKLVKGFDGCDGEGVVPFPIDVCENVVVAMVSERGQVKSVAHRLGTDGEVLLELQAGDFRAGLTYGIDVRATLNDKAVHAYGKSLVRITAATERGPRQVAQAADPYEVTLYVGYVTDVVPRKTSELVNDGADGEHPFATEEQLKNYAPLESPKFTGNPVYDDFSSPPNEPTFVLASKNWVRRSIEWFKTQANGIASLVNGKVPAAQIPDLPYIKQELKGKAGGVAELNGERRVWSDQLAFAYRGEWQTSQDIDATDIEPGMYFLKGNVSWPDILDGEGANGVLVQYPDNYKTQQLMVGRAANAEAGEQVETYTRRRLNAAGRWTAWSKGGDDKVVYCKIREDWISPHKILVTSEKSYEEILELLNSGKEVILSCNNVYTCSYISNDFIEFSSIRQLTDYRLEQKIIRIRKDGAHIGMALVFYELTLSVAKKGTSIDLGVMNAVTLKQAILYHTSDKANADDVYTKTEADERFQPKGNYLTEHQDISGKQDVQHTAVYTADSTAEDFHPMELGTLQEGENSWTLYKFFFKVDNLPNNTSLVVSLAQLLANYTIGYIVSVHGATSSGHFVSSGRTDDLSKVCVAQQGSRLRKEITLRTYADLSSDSATLLIEFYGTKDA